jgi:hypothetical protein
MLLIRGATSARQEESMAKKPSRKRVLELELPPMADLSAMTNAELVEYVTAEYTNLQRIWRMELLILPYPDWAIVEEVSRQMKQMEDAMEALRCL